MCVAPITIPNPNYGGDFYTYEDGRVISTNKRLIYTDDMIQVPCGKCVECRRSQYSSYLQRAQIESMTSYVYMITLTYDDQHIPSLSFTSDSAKVNIYYSNIKHVQDMFKRLRASRFLGERDFRYFAVTEYGSNYFRPHHHILLYVSRLNSDDDLTAKHLESYLYSKIKSQWCINVGSKRVPHYEPLFTFSSVLRNGKIYSNYDLHLVTNDSDDDCSAFSSAVKYLIGYMLKPNDFERYIVNVLEEQCDILPPDIYRKLSSIIKTRVYMSKHFGFGFDMATGYKVVPSTRYMRSNAFNTMFWQLFKQLPDNVSEFFDLYDEDGYRAFQDRLLSGNNRYIDFRDMFKSLSYYELLHLVAIYKYERKIFSVMIHRYSMDIETFSISLFPIRDRSYSYLDSVAYKTVRRMVDISHQHNIPFIGFIVTEQSKNRFIPLCKYYKRYVCVQQDYINWLDRIGVDSLADIEYDLSHTSKVASVVSYNTSISVDLLSRKVDNPYKKIPKNFDIIKNPVIFAPDYTTLMNL